MSRTLDSRKVIVAAWAWREKGWWSIKTAHAFMEAEMSEAEVRTWENHIWAVSLEERAQAEQVARQFRSDHES